MVKNWLTKLLFNWVFRLLCMLMQSLLWLVSFVEDFFGVFAGTARIIYKGQANYLISVFFGHDAVTNAFWAMALIAIIMCFGFCIFSMARRATDVSGTMKQSVGQIFSNFIRSLVIILLLNAMSVAAINITNVLLDQINYALTNAANLNQESGERTFTDREYATMTRVLATVGNYSVNPSADSRYNVNSCFNAIRGDLLALHVNGFFDYTYDMDENGHHTWQSALQLLATSADLTQDLRLDTYNEQVTYAVQTVSREISTYSGFRALKSAAPAPTTGIDTATTIFLIATMEAANNSIYNNGDFYDALRIGYVKGEKDYMSLKRVERDFDIWEIDYLVAYLACIVFFVIMCICIFNFVVRMFNLILLYLVAPLFASSMSLDEGGKFQSWTQAFVIQLFSGFGSVIAMRLYLIIIPITTSSDLVFFTESKFLNYMARLIMLLGGAWAVLQASGLITGILAGNPGMSAIQNEGRIGAMVTGWAMRAPRAAVQATGSILKAPKSMAGHLEEHRQRSLDKGSRMTALAERSASRKTSQADEAREKADSLRQQAEASGGSVRLNRRADAADKRAGRLERTASSGRDKAGRAYARYGVHPDDHSVVFRDSAGSGRTGGSGKSGGFGASGGSSVSGGSAASGGAPRMPSPPPPPAPGSVRERDTTAASDAVSVAAGVGASGGSGSFDSVSHAGGGGPGGGSPVGGASFSAPSGLGSASAGPSGGAQPSDPVTTPRARAHAAPSSDSGAGRSGGGAAPTRQPPSASAPSGSGSASAGPSGGAQPSDPVTTPRARAYAAPPSDSGAGRAGGGAAPTRQPPSASAPSGSGSAPAGPSVGPQPVDPVTAPRARAYAAPSTPPSASGHTPAPEHQPAPGAQTPLPPPPQRPASQTGGDPGSTGGSGSGRRNRKR